MSKPNIVNITTTQTFQNWFDKTNEMVDIMRDSVVTASVSGDITIGNAAIQGEFEANTIISNVELKINSASALVNGQSIDFSSPVHITNTQAGPAAIFQYNASGGTTRYATSTSSWDIGIDTATDLNFVMNNGAGGQFKLSPGGVLTIPSLEVTSDINFPVDGDGNVVGNLLVANASVTNTLTGNIGTFTDLSTSDFSATDATIGLTVGDLKGDIYHPAATGGNGAGKVLENGGPLAANPATFYGNVQGTVSSITNHNTNNLPEGTNNSVGESSPGARDGSNNLYFKESRVRGALTAGVGVGIIADPNDSNKTLIAIGQSVAKTAGVEFNKINLTAPPSGGSSTWDRTIFLDGGTGNITAEGDITAYGTVSDITMKENIAPIENALEKVSKLGGYTFNYKGDDTQLTGVIAQELKEVLPGIVYNTVDTKTGREIYAVRHGNIIGLLIEAIKELQEKVGK
jgi:hypothetical protein